MPLPGHGLIVGTSTLGLEARRARGVRRRDAAGDGARSRPNPEVGLDAAIAAVPELASARDTQAAILDATIDVWTGPVQETGGLGAISPEAGRQSIDYLTTLDLVPNPVTTDDVIDTTLLPSS